MPLRPIYVGDAFTLVPVIAEEIRQAGWDWDRDLLECTLQEGSAHFRATNPGKAYVRYHTHSGAVLEVEVEVREREGNLCACVFLCILGLLLVALALLLLWRKKRAPRNGPENAESTPEDAEKNRETGGKRGNED